MGLLPVKLYLFYSLHLAKQDLELFFVGLFKLKQQQLEAKVAIAAIQKEIARLQGNILLKN